MFIYLPVGGFPGFLFRLGGVTRKPLEVSHRRLLSARIVITL